MKAGENSTDRLDVCVFHSASSDGVVRPPALAAHTSLKETKTEQRRGFFGALSSLHAPEPLWAIASSPTQSWNTD